MNHAFWGIFARNSSLFAVVNWSLISSRSCVSSVDILLVVEKLFLVVVDLCLGERAEKERFLSCRDAEASASETDLKVVIDGDMYITRGSEEY